MRQPTRILSIEDDPTVRRSICGYLEDSGFEVIEAENGREGLDRIAQDRPDVILCDLRMPVMNGLEFLEALKDRDPDIPAIVVSGTGDMTDAIAALKLGAWDYLIKPIPDLQVLEHAIHKALERAELIRENQAYREHLEQTNRRLEASLLQLEDDETAARRIQFQLLPQSPERHGDFHFSYYLKTSTLLSGDFVDYFSIDDQHVGFYIADVSGHGVSSAFITVLLHTTINHLREQYRRGQDDTIMHPARLLAHFNAKIADQDFGKYLTMFYTVAHVGAATLTYCNGGHFPPPILRTADGCTFVEQVNLPVGLFTHAEYREETVTVPAPFELVKISDGVLDAIPEDRLEAKQDALLQEVERAAGHMEAFVRGLGLVGAEAPKDDVTVLFARKGA